MFAWMNNTTLKGLKRHGKQTPRVALPFTQLLWLFDHRMFPIYFYYLTSFSKVNCVQILIWERGTSVVALHPWRECHINGFDVMTSGQSRPRSRWLFQPDTEPWKKMKIQGRGVRHLPVKQAIDECSVFIISISVTGRLDILPSDDRQGRIKN